MLQWVKGLSGKRSLRNYFNNMYCPNCGVQQEGGEKFCAKCGQQMTPEHKTVSATEKKNYGLFNIFTISDDELKNQVEQHDTLPITKSSRGIAVLTLIGLLAFGTLVFFGLNLLSSDIPISYSDVIWSLIIYVPLIYFVYRGHMWAVIALGSWYTLDKFYTMISTGHFSVAGLIFWMIGIGPLWVAFKVEREYRKRKMNAAAN